MLLRGASAAACRHALAALARPRPPPCMPAAAQACGSGGTTAGIALGCHLSGLGLRVHAYTVCDDEQVGRHFRCCSC